MLKSFACVSKSTFEVNSWCIFRFTFVTLTYEYETDDMIIINNVIITYVYHIHMGNIIWKKF